MKDYLYNKKGERKMKNRNFAKKLNKNAESLAVVHTHTHTHTHM